MHRSEGEEILDVRRGPDWAGWIALIWAVGFGLLYAEMMARSRLPGIYAWVRRVVG